MTEAAKDAFLDALVEDDPVRLYEQAPCGFLSTAPDGTIVKINATLCTWLGTAREELVGLRSFVDLLTPGGRIYHETHYAPMLRMHDTVRELALELVRADGRRLPVLVNATLDRDPSGDPRVIRIAVFDATERRRYERELVGEKQRAEESEARARALARTLQQTLLPPVEPTVPGLAVAAGYHPAGDDLQVGGDFYDVFSVGADDWVFVLGDVCGKGAEAAVITALTRWTVRAAAVAAREPSRMLAQLNEVLERHETDRFCTAVVVRLHRDGHRWRGHLSVGGHPPPLLTGPHGNALPVPADGPLVGVFPSARFTDEPVVLEPGEGLVLFSDGVTDARRGELFFDDEGLVSSVGSHGPEPKGLVAGLLGDVMEFQDSHPIDDIAILAVQVPTEPAEP